MLISEKIINQYLELKKELENDHLLFMQVGAFMKVLDEDARKMGDLAGLKLSMVGSVDHPHITGGFPVTGLDKYVGISVRAGCSVAIARQDEKKDRQITEIIKIAPGE